MQIQAHINMATPCLYTTLSIHYHEKKKYTWSNCLMYENAHAQTTARQLTCLDAQCIAALDHGVSVVE